MNAMLSGILPFAGAGEAAGGAALALAGGLGWVLSLAVGWATPTPLIDSVGRAAVTASGCSLLALLAGLAFVVASIVS